ncbi:hypothetical protein DS884_01195 [Tenacibaculum sp. E3R01]|uniref:hypothetical protein n=1 Tax=Tenacibaculum sp. E3R01 TaxID=2267227 RepID=UPI000DEBABC9|nr:hypothetical protein [Tenacibaculum sp. E3R01]RBW62960.1 hypothetical protein DS884_01195 [Tenacibaculum sp. E3R01]
MNISKSQIKKLGRNIRKNQRENNIVDKQDLEKLQEYRVSFQNSMNTVFDFLVKRSKYHYKGSLTVYRLKRIDTIIRKINREKTMDFAKMQDIAGCRSIVDSISQIYKIVEDFDNNPNFEVIDRVDYIVSPRETGYVSYHLIVKPINDVRIVEIQLRTRTHHFWATLVEITDLVFDIKLKEGEDHPELFRFHKLLAKGNNKLTINDKIEIVNIERGNKIISQVRSIFKSNYYVSIDRWSKAQNKEGAKYLIMELDKNLSPDFYFFKDFLEAENSYFNKFTLDEPNMVLVHINEPVFEKIGLAYSNYVLTSHPSIRLYISILQEVIIHFNKENKKNEEIKYYEYYKIIIEEISASFESEINFIKEKINIAKESFNNNKYKNFNNQYFIEREQYFKVMNDWLENIYKRLNYISSSDNVFHEKIILLLEEKKSKKGSFKKLIDNLFKKK